MELYGLLFSNSVVLRKAILSGIKARYNIYLYIIMGKKKQPYVYNEPVPSYIHTSSFSLEICTSKIPNAGLGVVTHDFIPKHTCIDHYVGQYTSFPLSKYYISIREKYGIDAGSYPRCYMAMINDVVHSTYTVNCEFCITDDTVSVWSLRDIHEKEELFISYGNAYW
jgi:hypothetical protein